MRLNWAPPAADGGSPVGAYAVYIYDYPGPGSSIQEVTSPSASFSGLPSGSYFTFTVTAWNGHFWGAWSPWAAWTGVT